MSLEVNVCSVTDLLVGTRYTPQQNLHAWKRPTIMHGIAGRSLEDRGTAGFPLTKNYLWLGAPSVILVHFAASLGPVPFQHKIRRACPPED